MLYKKWILLVVFSFLFLILQSTEILALVFNAKPTLIFPFAICCAIFLKKEEASILGVICGFFLDCFSNLIFGFSSFILLIFCYLASVICKKYVNVCLINILVLNFIFFFFYCFLIFIFKYLISDFECVWAIWLHNFLPSIIYTTITAPILFILSEKICFNTKHREKNSKKYSKANNINRKGKAYEQ